MKKIGGCCLLVLLITTPSLFSCKKSKCTEKGSVYRLDSDSACVGLNGKDTIEFDYADSMGNMIKTSRFIGSGKFYTNNAVENVPCGEGHYENRGIGYVIWYHAQDSSDSFRYYIEPVSAYTNRGYITFPGLSYSFSPAQDDSAGPPIVIDSVQINKYQTGLADQEGYKLFFSCDKGLLRMKRGANVIMTRVFK